MEPIAIGAAKVNGELKIRREEDVERLVPFVFLCKPARLSQVFRVS